uniref:ACYPI008667 protein n=1 Tax=Acyrthosiphon pisum TaxID=7029 RepID=C4WRX5_ACYPI|nr:ACYPI008667 [Acyrthosiphon pisum]
MFLSYATVAVFAYAILLNIFHLYSPVESAGVGEIYKLCEDCLVSECHASGRPCITRYDSEYKFTCFICANDSDWDQFYCLDECTKGCEDKTMECVCDGSCYMCVQKDADKSQFLECMVPR